MRTQHHVRHLLRNAAGVGLAAALISAALPTATALAAGTVTVTSTNGQAGATAASNTATATVGLSMSSTYLPSPAPTVTFARHGATTDKITITNGTLNATAKTISVNVPFSSANPGLYDITVTQGSTASDSCASCFTVLSPAPTVSSVSSPTVAQSGASYFIVTGTHFARGNYPQSPSTNSNYSCATCAGAPTIQLKRGGVVATGISLQETRTSDGTAEAATPSTSTTITKVVGVTTSAALGAYDIVVTNSDGQVGTCGGCFTVVAPMTGTASPSSRGQGSTGGVITVSGANFPTDVTGGIFDPNAGARGEVPGVTWSFARISSTQLQFTNVAVAANATVGPRTVSLSSASIHDAYSMPFAVSAAPTASLVAMTDGQQAGYGQGAIGVHVQVTGTGFTTGTNAAGTTLAFNPAGGITVTASQATSATNINATLTLAAGTAVGDHVVRVVNPDGGAADCSAQLPTDNCALTVNPGPTITSITPNAVGRDTSHGFTFTGTNVSGGATAPTITITGFTGGTSALDSNNPTTTATFSGAHASATVTGPQSATLVNNDDLGRVTCTACVTITSLEVDPGNSAAALNTGTKTGVTVTGHGFDRAATVDLVKIGLGSTTVPSIHGTVTTAPSTTTSTSADGTSLVASFPLNAVDPGTYAFQVTNPVGTFAGVGQGGVFTVVAASPTLTSASPNSRGAGTGSQVIHLVGTGFGPHPTVTFSNAGVVVDSTSRIDAAHIDVTVHITQAAPIGSGTVTVTNTDNQSASAPFTITVRPEVTAVAPASKGQGADPFQITVSGTAGSFPTSGNATLVFSNAGVTATNIVVTPGSTDPVSPTDDTLTATVTVSPTATVGLGDVTVQNTASGAQGTCTGCFRVLPAPVLSAVSPSSGAVGTAVPVTLTGSGFLSGATVTAGPNVTVTNVVVASATSITATFTSAANPALNDTFADIRVRNTDGGTDVLLSGYHLFGAPAAPAGVSATAGDASATVSWTAPANNGDQISSYTVTSSPDGLTATVTGAPAATTATVTGLTNGTSYTFTVTAHNRAGDSPASGASAAVTPKGVPATPTGVTATAGNASASVSWTAPADNGATISSYTVTTSPGGATTTVVGSPAGTTATVNNLTNGTAYTFTVVAHNAAGNSPASAPSLPVTPRTVPGAPTGVSAAAADRSAVVSWTAPASDGGSAITSYTATASPGGATATVAGDHLSATVTGLTNGTAYTFTVVATNAVGSSAPSSAASATPAVVPGAPTNVTATPGNQTVLVSWGAPASTGGAPITGYTVTPSSGQPVTTTSTSHTFTGLTNGTTYTFTVVANNSRGAGPGVVVSAEPVSGPTAPTSVQAAPGDGTVTVSFSGATPQGSPITGYTVRARLASGGVLVDSVDGTSSPITVGGLSNGTAYVFNVIAHNQTGSSAPSTASATATPQFVTHLTSTIAPVGIAAGTTVRLSGYLTRASTHEAISGATVYVSLYSDGGSHRQVKVGTRSDGYWAYEYPPSYSTTVYATYLATTDNARTDAKPYKFGVHSRVTITAPASTSTSSHTNPLVVSGQVSPDKSGELVHLVEVFSNGSTNVLKTLALDGNSAFSFKLLSSPVGTHHYQVTIAATTGNTAGASVVLTVKRT